MSKYEKELIKSLPKAAQIVRDLRHKAGMVDEMPLDDFEICSLEKLHEVWIKEQK